MHSSSYNNMGKFVDTYLSGLRDKKLEIIDIGSQNVNGTYKPIFQNPNLHYTGADIVSGENVDLVIKNMYNWWNIRANSYDVVISGQTFEHIEYFWFTIMEIARILKSGGLCCIIAPSSGEEHRYPVDCWRFYSDGFNALARYAGLEVVEVYTQWAEQQYPDHDPMWRDTVLICRKHLLTPTEKVKFYIKNKLSIFMAICLDVKIHA